MNSKYLYFKFIYLMILLSNFSDVCMQVHTFVQKEIRLAIDTFLRNSIIRIQN